MDNRLHCQWCHRFEISGTETHLCRKCGKIHQACERCFKRNSVLEGAFPNYALALNACPPACNEANPCLRCFPKKPAYGA